MSQRIYAEITHEFKRRMENWGRYNSRGGLAEISPSSMWSSASGGGFRESVIPTLEGEASDTDRALNTLPIRERQAVMLFWQYNGKPLTYLAKRCGGIDYRTYEDRVIKGHIALNCEIRRYSDMMRDQRSLIEKLHAA